MKWKAPSIQDLIFDVILSNDTKKERNMELVTNGDEGAKCEDYTDETPWIEFRLWGYNLNTKTDKFRCHFCKQPVTDPKPFEAACKDDGCIAFWALTMIDRKK